MKKIVFALAALAIATPSFANEAQIVCIVAHSGNEQRPVVGQLDRKGPELCKPMTRTTLNR